MNDTLGLIGNLISEKLPEWGPIIMPVIFAAGAAIFRALQKILQILPTKWKWVNNKLTVSIISKIIGALFGKTTLVYNMQVENKEQIKAEAKKEVIKHLSKKGGILKEFNEAMEKLK